MKAWELEEGKEYRINQECKSKYRIKDNKLEYCPLNGDWIVTAIPYNHIKGEFFEEIKQPMTFVEAMEWMAKSRENVTKYVDCRYAYYTGLIFADCQEWTQAPITTEMVNGEWYKED